MKCKTISVYSVISIAFNTFSTASSSDSDFRALTSLRDDIYKSFALGVFRKKLI